MKLCDVIKSTNNILRLGISINLFNKTEYDAQLLSALQGQPLADIIACANRVLDEICCQYIPLMHKQELTADEGGVIDFDLFEKPLLKVYRVVTSNGERLRFTYLPCGISVAEKGALRVVYSYKIGEKNFLDDVDVGSSMLTERIIAYGIASEYCLLREMHDEASIWDKRYKDALFGALRKRKEVKIPPRLFV